MSEELRRRLQAADPALRDVVPRSWANDLTEATMRAQTASQRATGATALPARSRRRVWTAVSVAAAVMAVAATVTTMALDRSSGPGAAGGTAVTTVTLRLPGGTSLQSCLPYDVRNLADMPVAFGGTPVSVTKDQVLIRVERWFTRGPRPDRVRVVVPDTATTSLSGAVDFRQGQRYLVSATRGTVNLCGYSGSWTPRRERDFEQAFAS